MQGRNSNLEAFSLIKSKEILQKIATQVEGIPSNRENSLMLQSIQTSSKQVERGLDHQIEQNFNCLLNGPTLMPLDLTKDDPFQKENKMPTNTTAIEGAKTLMYQYWQRNKKHINTKSSKSRTQKPSEPKHKLPQINQTNDFKIAAFIKAKQKEQQLGFVVPREQNKQDYHIKINIIGYRVRNQGKSFFKFQKLYFKKWEEISSVLKALQKFAEYYQLTMLTVLSRHVFAIIAKLAKGHKFGTHDLLGCCEHAETISQQNSHQAGIRFYGKNGTLRAAVVIQSHIRKYLEQIRHKRRVLEWKTTIKIQSFYRGYRIKKTFKSQLLSHQLQKINKFNSLQKYFSQTYRNKQLHQRTKYQIHIPSHSSSQWQKISTQKYLEKQNSQLCRIFKVAQKNHLNDTKIIYISPIELSKEIVRYYQKLMELASEEQLENRVIFLTPENHGNMPVNLSLTQMLYYSPRTLKKIKTIIKNNYAYIVPSSPSNDYIHLCTELKVPLYASAPASLAYLNTQSGFKTFVDKLNIKDQSLSILPYSMDIYSQSSLLNELTNLIYRYPYVRRWLLKIDNQNNSRGIAHLDIYKIMGKFLSKFIAEPKTISQKVVRQQIYSMLENSLITNRQQRIIPLDKQAYPSQSSYLSHFYTRGGILEAPINNFETDIENSCFCIDIEPDGEWKFLCSYFKITHQHKTVGAYYDSKMMEPPLAIDQIVQQLKRDKMFGYFTLEFLSIDHSLEKTMKKVQNKVYYLNSIDCRMGPLASANYLRQFISKDSHTLFLPILQHPAIKELRMQTFFHLCRLQNISFDIQKRIGNVFTFMDGLQSGCLGIMTFNQASREDCYSHTAEVLDFLNSKLKQSNGAKDIPASFFAIKSAVNGYLNREKKRKIKTEKTIDHC